MMNVQGELQRQSNVLSAIPANLWHALPASITFAVVRYVENIVVPMIPNPSGAIGGVVNALLGGALTATNMVVWDAYKSGSIPSSG